MFNTILLDLDGTLVDSNAFHAAAWSEASRLYGYDKDEAFFRPLIGMGGDRVLRLIDPALTDTSGPGKAMAAARAKIFRSDYLPTLRPTPGAKALVERLHELGLRCVVASSTNASDLDDLLEVAGIRDSSTSARPPTMRKNRSRRPISSPQPSAGRVRRRARQL
jgi:beta-phosphoglucomutase-like phosphatase (HAD superfamily)